MSLACPSTVQCTALNEANQKLTFDPVSAVPGPAVIVGRNLGFDTWLSYPSASECVAVGGRELTFNPNSPTHLPGSGGT
jgi:hypothetical protein